MVTKYFHSPVWAILWLAVAITGRSVAADGKLDRMVDTQAPAWSDEEKELLQAGADLFRLCLQENRKDYAKDIAEITKTGKVPEFAVPEKFSEMIMTRYRSAFRVTKQDAVQESDSSFRERAQREIHKDVKEMQKLQISFPRFPGWLIARFQAGKITRKLDLDFTRRVVKGLRADVDRATKEGKK